MMKIKSELVKKLQRKTVNQSVRICIDCGSRLIFLDETKISCKECGTTRIIKKQTTTFETDILNKNKNHRRDLSFTFKII